MNKKNIYIYHSGYYNRDLHGHTFFVPYIYGLLRSYSEQYPEIKKNYSWPLPHYFSNDLDEYISCLENPSVIGLSCYLWNWEKIKKISSKVKSLWPDCTIVLGGPQVPIDQPEVIKEIPWVDIIVHQEGEHKFYLILKELLNTSPDFSHINGISYVQNGELIQTPPAKRMNLDNFPPSPLVLGYFDEYNQAAKKQGFSLALSFETTRGCPYTCSFCDWGSNIASKFRNFPKQRILDEIDRACEDGYQFIFGADSNYGIFTRDLEFTKRWVAGKEKFNAPAEMHMNMAKNTNKTVLEIGDLIQKKFQVPHPNTLSVQSMSEQVLKNIGRQNIGLKNYTKMQEHYESKGVATYTELIIGLPGETLNSWKEGIGKLLDMDLKEIVVYPFVLSPNAPVVRRGDIQKYSIQSTKIKRSEGKFIFDGRDYFEFIDIVTKTKDMSYDDYIEMNTYSEFVLATHYTNLTSHIAKYFHAEYQVSLSSFYTELFNFYKHNPDTLIGNTIQKVQTEIPKDLNCLITRHMGPQTFEINNHRFQKMVYFKHFYQVNFLLQIHNFFDEIKFFLTNFFNITLNEKDKELFKFLTHYAFKPDDIIEFSVMEFDYEWDRYLTEKQLVKSRTRYQFESTWRSPRHKNHFELFIDLKTNIKISNLFKKPIPNFNKVQVLN